jgi:uncharacterized protein (TIGR00251 family)
VWARRHGDGWHLAVRVQPGARASEVVGRHGDELRVRVAGRAVEGRANAEVERFLATALGVPARSVHIVRGRRNRSKVVAVDADLPIAALVELTP